MDDQALARLEAALEVLRTAEPFDEATVEREQGAVVERLGVKPGQLYQPLRVAVTGTTVSPGIFDTLAALGRDEAISRIEGAILRLRAGTHA